jgi:hypothetical protein
MAFFPHIGTSAVGFQFTALAETTFSGVLDSIVSDLGAGIGNWSLWDDQRVSGSGNFITAYGNCGGNDTGATTNFTAWTNGQNVPSTGGAGYWGSANGINTEAYPLRTSMSFDKGNNWYVIQNVPTSASGGGSVSNWGFNIDRNYAGTTFTTGQPYWVKLTKYIILQYTSAQKTFYVLLARPDSACDILRVQVYETWNNSTHVGTNPGPMEIMRGSDVTENVYWNNNWDAQPVKYMLWLLPEVFGLWAGYGSGQAASTYAISTKNIGNQLFKRSDFVYIGNLDTSQVRTNDPNALVFACSNTQLSGFASWWNALYGNTPNPNTPGGSFGAMRCLRTLQGELWSMPSGGNNVSRPALWNMNNQYAVWPRTMPYHYRLDSTLADTLYRTQCAEVDVYHVGGPNALWGSAGGTGSIMNTTGSAYNEGKRGTMRYLKFPSFNPSGGHLMQLNSADDGNIYILFRATWPQRSAGVTTFPGATNYNLNDSSVGSDSSFAAMSSFAYSAKTGQIGEVTVASQNTSVVFRWFMMPINL